MKTRTTTIRIPEPLYQQAKSLVKNEKLSASAPSLNDLFVAAIRSYLKARRRREIDDQFAGMASDPVYQKESKELIDAFASSDWETLQLV
jgi:hypothetical protein